ncbi:MgtC/SapB family protein [Almyronema epifaneia]|uniref:MgtC/SapB family protein n=1 Tax=Almyronema epifaneia S1 TaxID=2991925 RepID=A0ABW6IDS6_9CYAN
MNSGTQLLLPLAPPDLLIRLGLALLFGAVIGWERESRDKPAGLRTHMLVSFGSALFVLSSIQTGAVEQSADVLSRVIQGVASGVGFLGAGEIVQQSRSESDRIRIRGLTSAAAIWTSAALGVVAACGLWQIGLIACIVTVAILLVFRLLEKSVS